MVWIWVDLLSPIVFCLVLVYLIDNSWMISIDVVIYPMRCGLALVFRCWGLSKVRCGGEGRVHGVWQMLKSAKDLFLGVDPLGQDVLPRVQYGTAC
jgi:ABC-type dipeptide/oligopeptide/nickel transport system permease subunit